MVHDIILTNNSEREKKTVQNFGRTNKQVDRPRKKKGFVKRERSQSSPSSGHRSSFLVQHQQQCLSRPSGNSRTLFGYHCSTLPGIRLVHRRDFTSDGGPFHLAAQWAAATLALEFFPLEEFVAVMRLSDLAASSTLCFGRLTRISSEAG